MRTLTRIYTYKHTPTSECVPTYFGHVFHRLSFQSTLPYPYSNGHFLTPSVVRNSYLQLVEKLVKPALWDAKIVLIYFSRLLHAGATENNLNLPL